MIRLPVPLRAAIWRLLPVVLLTLSALGAGAQVSAPRPGSSAGAGSPDPAMPRPIDAFDTVFLEEMTWLEVRDAMRSGKRTVIVATGGVEMNGPYLALGKHNIILRATTEAIARQLGDALVAPIVAFVPEGEIEPPSGMMRYPGSISLSAATYKALLTDIARSLRAHGFSHVIFIGDSGGNQAGMREVADDLNTRWANESARVHFIPEYYDYPGLTRWLASQGVREVDEGHHDDYGISTLMMVTDPQSVRARERMKAGKFSINGVSLAPIDSAIAMGRRAVAWRSAITVDAIRKARGR